MLTTKTVEQSQWIASFFIADFKKVLFHLEFWNEITFYIFLCNNWPGTKQTGMDKQKMKQRFIQPVTASNARKFAL